MKNFVRIKLDNTCNKRSNGCKLQLEISRVKVRILMLSNTLDPLSQKLENENVELEFQVRNYEKEIAHLKTTYKNLFDSISVTRAQTKTIIDSLQHKLHDTIYENAKLRAQLFDKVSDQVDTTKGTSTNTKFANQSTERKPSLQPDMNSRGKKQKANVSNTENQKKQKPKVIKPKKVGSKERLASPKPSKPRFCLRWSPTGRFFDIKGKIIASSESESQSDCSNGDNACTSNPSEPKIKRFPNSTFFLGRFRGCFQKEFLFCQISRIDVDLLKETVIQTFTPITVHEMASASPNLPHGTSNFYKSWVMASSNSPVIIIRTDNGTEFKNQILKEYFDSVGISHQASSVRTPQQNGVVERRNRTLVEAARTMLIFSRAPLFLWAEAIATACYTQNRSIIHRRFNKTPYELINGRKPDISFLHVFGALCYPKNDREDIGKLGAKETMNVTFDELSAMAFEQRLQSMTSGQITSGLDLTYGPSTITTQKPTKVHGLRINPPGTSNGRTLSASFDKESQLRSRWTLHVRINIKHCGTQNAREAMTDPTWIDSMQEELLQFKRLDHDEENTACPKQSRLVVRGNRQEEGIDLKNPSLRWLEWKLSGYFLAMPAHKSYHMCFQMDVKTAFLDGTLNGRLQNRRDLPRNFPLDRVEVLEQSQQGIIGRDGLNIEGLKHEKELNDKGVKKKALHTTLGRNRINANLIETSSDDSLVFTVKMEILLEPTSNKLLVGDLRDSI
ncbi:retrovirus-related pol polyprotein from transposon TNT 1-94 [Tanacetum coccineum]|uniref:Retrovirus-related pol polyprotein from transposon TNT 1-94 n=1 Tax=Tanacetum coccineum TaxID=301880 RepID=A0ABQ5AIG2_9ASTR